MMQAALTLNAKSASRQAPVPTCAALFLNRVACSSQARRSCRSPAACCGMTIHMPASVRAIVRRSKQVDGAAWPVLVSGST